MLYGFYGVLLDTWYVVCWIFETMMTVKIVIHFPWGGLDIEFQAAFTKSAHS